MDNRNDPVVAIGAGVRRPAAAIPLSLRGERAVVVDAGAASGGKSRLDTRGALVTFPRTQLGLFRQAAAGVTRVRETDGGLGMHEIVSLRRRGT